MDTRAIRSVLERLTKRSSTELLSKEPHWGDAILCDALVQSATVLAYDAPLQAAVRWFDPKLTAGPRLAGWFWFWSAEALAAIDLHLATRRDDFLSYARKIVEALTTTALRTPDGALVPHPPAMEVWVDVAYFSAPAMAQLGQITGSDDLIERALDQLLVHHRHLVDDRTGLLWHVAYIDKRSHSPCLWARGNSWFSIAGTQVLATLGTRARETRFKAKADAIRVALARQLNAIVALQDRSGLWHTVIDRPDSYLESSATGGFALALGRALALSLDGLEVARASAAYEGALDAVCAKVDGAGDFMGVSQQTPPGDFDFYNSIKLGTAPFGAGVCMMALAEKLRPDIRR